MQRKYQLETSEKLSSDRFSVFLPSQLLITNQVKEWVLTGYILWPNF